MVLEYPCRNLHVRCLWMLFEIWRKSSVAVTGRAQPPDLRPFSCHLPLSRSPANSRLSQKQPPASKVLILERARNTTRRTLRLCMLSQASGVQECASNLAASAASLPGIGSRRAELSSCDQAGRLGRLGSPGVLGAVLAAGQTAA